MPSRDQLAALSQGFRTSYLDYAGLTRQLEAWAAAFPAHVRHLSLGKSPEGRDLWALVIGEEPDTIRPAVWVDGNMHASELCGSSVALAVAEEVLALHAGETTVLGLPAAMAEAIKAVHFYVVPRMSPDGAEAVLKTGRYLRSSAEDDRRHLGHAHWRAEDADGDGIIASMRLASPLGDQVELPGFPGVLVPREPGDDGPFYKVYPEGTIVNFDGRHIPDSVFLGDNPLDFNRNYPYSWAPEPDQLGAGAFPGSAPETQAVIQFITSRPNIFALINLHTFGGVVIRPEGDRPDSKMNQDDLAVYRQLEAWLAEFTGYPTVSAFHEFLYTPEQPMRGDLMSYAYNQRGALSCVIELWDLFTRLGVPRRHPFVDHYTHLSRAELTALARWDQEVNHGRIYRPWRTIQHPQLGEVGIGGPDLRVGITNPPYELLAEVCRSVSTALLRLPSLLPRLVLAVEPAALGSGLTRLEVRLRNTGYLGSHGLSSARRLPHCEPLRMILEADGCELAAPHAGPIAVGHLEGWGSGLFAKNHVVLPWSRGGRQEEVVTVITKGQGSLKIRAGSCRTGFVEQVVAVGR